ncbi:Extradiol ring-cleavage dioxygenase, class III enzyme, subunit B [Zopfochytrium polystomum]|nr:Extradiol ring-cleavage dioxygenase, class III enzyme, subunit B [Zopfochytrium polystomum]
MTPPRQPAYFLAHGNPYWIVAPQESGPRYLASLGKKILASDKRPTSVLVISAHWETSNGLKVTTAAQHDLLYDYYGFPKSFYDVRYPARGSPDLAARTSQLLQSAGFKVTSEPKRGLDHGAFTPLMYMFPNRELPVVQLSLPVTRGGAGGGPEEYLRMGRALAPLRDEGVLVLGLGYVTHNLRVFQTMGIGNARAPPEWATDFTRRVRAAVVDAAPGAERDAALLATYEAPSYRMASPSPEHYAPVLVAAGAGMDDKGVLVNEGWDSQTFSFSEDCFRFGSDY